MTEDSNMNTQILNIFQIILALLLIVLILIQSKGTGLGSTFGGDMGFYGTKRGAEKMIFNFTIVVSVLFFVTSLAGVILSKWTRSRSDQKNNGLVSSQP